MRPSFVLASKENSFDQRYAPWFVARIGAGLETTKRVLATSLIGNDMMIEFMSNYRTKIDSKTQKDYRKFYPKGALCWFPCDDNGNQRGAPIYIMRVPNRVGRTTDDKWKLMRKRLLAEHTLTDKFVKDDRFYPLICSHIAPLLMQTAKDAEDHKLEQQRFIEERRLYGRRKD